MSLECLKKKNRFKLMNWVPSPEAQEEGEKLNGPIVLWHPHTQGGTSMTTLLNKTKLQHKSYSRHNYDIPEQQWAYRAKRKVSYSLIHSNSYGNFEINPTSTSMLHIRTWVLRFKQFAQGYRPRNRAETPALVLWLKDCCCSGGSPWP